MYNFDDDDIPSHKWLSRTDEVTRAFKKAESEFETTPAKMTEADFIKLTCQYDKACRDYAKYEYTDFKFLAYKMLKRIWRYCESRS